MIEELRLQNFKSWKGPIQAKFAPLTGFFGTNSSGKTSLWQILLLLKQTVQSHDQSRILNTGGSKSDLIDVGSVPEIIYQNGSSFDFGITWHKRRFSKNHYDVSIEHEKGNIYVKKMLYRWFINYILKSDDKPIKIETSRVKVNDKYGYKILFEDEFLSVSFTLPFKCYIFPQSEFLNERLDNKYIQKFLGDFENLFTNLYYLGPLREYPYPYYDWRGDNRNVGIRGEFAIQVLLEQGKKPLININNKATIVDISPSNEPIFNDNSPQEISLETRIAQCLIEMGLVHSFRVHPLVENRLYEVRVRRYKSSPEVLLTEMGFGISQVLPVLVLCYACPVGSILILEQPEIHLHPAVQAALADVFIDVIKTRGVQIILESHSEHLLRRLQRRIAEKQLEVNDTALYFCEMGEDGASQLRSLELNTFGEIANWPKDFFGNMMDDILQIMEARLGE